MEPTGVDLVYFSCADPRKVFLDFAETLRLRWGRIANADALLNEPEQGVNDAHALEFFFCRDAAMRERHERLGYQVGENGGCCMLMARSADFDHAAIVVGEEYGRQHIEAAPYSATLIGNGLTEFTLVVPADPRVDSFSAFLVSALMTAVGHADRKSRSSKAPSRT